MGPHDRCEHQRVLYGIAAALPYMKAQKSGHFINVSSVAGHKVTPGGTVYCATKHAVRVISEGLRQEVKAYPSWPATSPTKKAPLRSRPSTGAMLSRPIRSLA